MESWETAGTEIDPRLANGDDLLWRHLKTVPAFRALLRATEARFYRYLALQEPILDLGCGDGHFAQMAFDRPLSTGVDPWWGPLVKARRTDAYGMLVQSSGNRLPFADDHFSTVISNSVLEHIQEVEDALAEANRVLRPGGKLVVTMPSHLFTEWLGGATLLTRWRLSNTADGYRRFFNLIARHAHTDSPEVWADRLAATGYSVTRWQYYFSRKALWALELGHFQGIPSAVLHFLTGQWIIAPWKENLKRTERWIRPYFEEEAGDLGAYIFMVAEKRSDGPIEAELPAAQPFNHEELTRGPRSVSAASESTREITEPGPSPLFRPSSETDGGPIVPRTEPLRKARSEPIIRPALRLPVISSLLMLAGVLSAMIGQSILRDHPSNPARAVRWLGASAVALALLYASRSAPARALAEKWREGASWGLDPRRWFYLLGVIVVFISYRSSGGPGQPLHPAIPIILWLAGIGVAVHGLAGRRSWTDWPRPSRFTVIASAALFMLALLPRLLLLTTHPFILNGVEASIGLDALNVAKGIVRDPFSTAWLTNPTLPAFLVALPIRLLGPSVLSIRLLSPFVGALTVVVVYWIGGRLYGRGVGLTAAILLAGSHFHLHYSRLGMTNIWDPLLMLLALGLTAIAWRTEDAGGARVLWLSAGAIIGLNAYFFTSSRLLPLTLLAVLLYLMLFRFGDLARRWRHLFAAVALAVVVSMPQVLFYRSHPGVFLERARAIGILEGQSGWLAQESERSGRDEAELLIEQLRRAALSYNFELDRSPAYRPEVPLLSFGPAALFFLGFLMAVFRLRQIRYLLLVVWVVVVTVFAGALLIETPSSHRLVIASPALSLLAAIALDQIGISFVSGFSRQSKNDGRSGREYLLPVLVVIAALMSVNDLVFYFGRYQEQHTYGDRNTEIAHAFANYLNSLDGEWTVYFHGPPNMYVGFPTIPFLATGYRSGVNLHDVLQPGAASPPVQTDNFVHVYLPERASELDAMRQQYPSGRQGTVDGYYASPLFYAYEVRR